MANFPKNTFFASFWAFILAPTSDQPNPSDEPNPFTNNSVQQLWNDYLTLCKINIWKKLPCIFIQLLCQHHTAQLKYIHIGIYLGDDSKYTQKNFSPNLPINK